MSSMEAYLPMVIAGLIKLLASNDYIPDSRIAGIKEDQKIKNRLVFILENGTEVKVLVYDEGDKFCFRIEGAEQEMLVEKKAVLGKPI